MREKTCPKCRSKNIKIVENNDIEFVKCSNCGYDESLYEITPTQRSTQREKSKYTPYTTGGSKRAQKKSG